MTDAKEPVAGEESEDTVIHENQMKDREQAITEDRDDRDQDGWPTPEQSGRTKGTDPSSLAEVAEKAKRAPRDG